MASWRLRRQALDSPDVAWQEAAIRVMPGPAGTDFLAAIDEVPAQAAAQPLVAMCNGKPWWRCHWRLVADFAEIIRGVPVRHLMQDGRSAVHLSLARVAAQHGWPAGLRRESGTAGIVP